MGYPRRNYKCYTRDQFTDRVKALSDSSDGNALTLALREAKKYYGIEFACELAELFNLESRFGINKKLIHGKSA